MGNTDMSDIKEIAKDGQTVWESCKNVFLFLKERQWFAAFKESFNFLKLIYLNHLKGKYIVVKGKKIPRTMIAVLGLFAIYIFLPSNEQTPSAAPKPAIEKQKAQKDANFFDENGLKVFDLRKCETEESVGACGTIENYGDNILDKLVVSLVFYAPDGTPVYEGSVEASNIQAHTDIKINIPCSVDFAYFKLKEVKPESSDSAE